MGTQQFCLKWNNHQLNMLSVFDHLLQNEAFVDVTLACEGLSLKAHKMVLSACSPYFQNLFMDNPCPHPIVILKDIQYKDMKSIIDFMYKGEVNVAQEELTALLKTADALKVKGLAEVSGQVTQSPVPESSSSLAPTLPPQQQQQQAQQEPSKSPVPKRKRRHAQPPSPCAISNAQPPVNSLPLPRNGEDSSSDSRSFTPKLMKKTESQTSFQGANELMVAHLKEERIDEGLNDVEEIILEESREHLEIDTDPSVMPYSNDGMDQENLSPMRNESYTHSASIPSTSQTGSDTDVCYDGSSEQQKFLSAAASTMPFWMNNGGGGGGGEGGGGATGSPALVEPISLEILFESEEETRGKLEEFISSECVETLEKLNTSGKLINNLMNALFSKDELAISSVTGKKSPRSLEAKKALDPLRATLVIAFTHHKFPSESIVTIKQKMAQKLKASYISFFGIRSRTLPGSCSAASSSSSAAAIENSLHFA